MTGLPPNDGDGVKVVVISIVFTIISISFVGLRVWAKRLRGRLFRAHDYFIFAALVRLQPRVVTDMILSLY